jgi:hypothetical protein
MWYEEHLEYINFLLCSSVFYVRFEFSLQIIKYIFVSHAYAFKYAIRPEM